MTRIEHASCVRLIAQIGGALMNRASSGSERSPRRAWLFGVVLIALAACRPGDQDCTNTPQTRVYFDLPEGEQTMDKVSSNMVRCLDEAPATGRASALAGDEDAQMQTMLKALYTDAAPDVAALRDMSGRLDRVMRPPQGVSPPVTTLLNEAVRQQNIRWTRALLEAGADPNASGSGMAYSAVQIFHPGSPSLHIFNDGSPATVFLRAYIDHGGLVNTAEGGGRGDLPLFSATTSNLAALVFLLENGADPWYTSYSPSRLRFPTSALGALIWGGRAPDYAEQITQLAEKCLLRPPDQPLYREISQQTLRDHLELYGEASGPTERHKLWQVQQAVRALIDADVVRPSPAILDLLDRHAVPDAEGGWILHEGALWQRHDDPQEGSVLGTNIH